MTDSSTTSYTVRIYDDRDGEVVQQTCTGPQLDELIRRLVSLRLGLYATKTGARGQG